VPAADIVSVLTLGAGRDQIAPIGGVMTMRLDGRARPVISLQRTLFVQPPAGGTAREDQVVVLQVGEQLFGLLAERVGIPERVELLPTLRPVEPLSVFTALVRRGAEVAFVLSPTRLGMSADGVMPADMPKAA
jgi:hypothetical protein